MIARHTRWYEHRTFTRRKSNEENRIWRERKNSNFNEKFRFYLIFWWNGKWLHFCQVNEILELVISQNRMPITRFKKRTFHSVCWKFSLKKQQWILKHLKLSWISAREYDINFVWKRQMNILAHEPVLQAIEHFSFNGKPTTTTMTTIIIIIKC